jgi:hypothetical protein
VSAKRRIGCSTRIEDTVDDVVEEIRAGKLSTPADGPMEYQTLYG